MQIGCDSPKLRVTLVRIQGASFNATIRMCLSGFTKESTVVNGKDPNAKWHDTCELPVMDHRKDRLQLTVVDNGIFRDKECSSTEVSLTDLIQGSRKDFWVVFEEGFLLNIILTAVNFGPKESFVTPRLRLPSGVPAAGSSERDRRCVSDRRHYGGRSEVKTAAKDGSQTERGRGEGGRADSSESDSCHDGGKKSGSKKKKKEKAKKKKKQKKEKGHGNGGAETVPRKERRVAKGNRWSKKGADSASAERDHAHIEKEVVALASSLRVMSPRGSSGGVVVALPPNLAASR